MTRDAAINLARATLGSEPGWNLESFSATRKHRNSRSIWLVIFERSDEKGLVVSPGEIFIEVDEESQVANIVRNP